MVLYGITLVPLAEELRDVDTTFLSSFFSDDTNFYGLTSRSAAQLQVLMERGPDRVYFLDLDNSLFIANYPE